MAAAAHEIIANPRPLFYRTGICEAEPVLVGIYTRISRDDDGRAVGVVRQERLCREFASARGWDVFRVYCDNDRSASSYARGPRPAFEALLADLGAQRFDRVLVLAQDRLVRRPEQLEDVMRLLHQNGGASVESVFGGHLDVRSSAGRAQARIKVVFDAAYADFISERVTLAKRERAERGLPPGGGARPFGYLRGGMVVDPAEATLIREAADRVISGEPLYTICADWTRRGVQTAQGTFIWRSGVLRKVLAGPRLVGLREYRGEIVGRAAWPAILDPQTYANVLAAFGDTTRLHGGRPRGTVHLLSGIARCGRCDRTLFSNVVKGTRYYVCRSTPTRGGCGRLGMKAQPVDAYVVTCLLRSVSESKVRSSTAAKYEEVLGQLESDRESLDALTLRRYVQRDLSQREYEVARAALLSSIESNERRSSIYYRQLHDLTIDNETWAQWNIDVQRAFLGEHLARVAINPAVRGRSRIDFDRIQLTLRDDSPSSPVRSKRRPARSSAGRARS